MRAVRVACALLAATAAFGLPQGAAGQEGGSVPAARSTLANAGPVERYFSDALLTARVKLALLDAPEVSAVDIGVQTHRGVVQLSGFVDHADQVRRAGEIATRIQGVIEVHNVLQVKG